MTNTHTGEFVPVGVVVKPHGIRGEFCIKSYADSPLLFERVAAVYLREGRKRPKSFTVQSWRRHKGFVLLTLEGVADRDQAEVLRGRDVLIHERELPELDEGEFYIRDLIGCRVRLEDGTDVGELAHFYENPQQDTWVIMTDDDVEVLLPAVREFLVDVDLDAKVIVIDPPEGLLDIYLNPEPPKKKKPRHRKKSRRKKA